jgi:hypothetical protein
VRYVVAEGRPGVNISSSQSTRTTSAPYAAALEVREAVVAYHEAVCSPRVLDDDALVGTTYDALATATRAQISLEEWTRRLLEDRIRELQARLEVVGERTGEGRRWWQRGRRAAMAPIIDHRNGISVIEVDLVVVDGGLAAASVVLVLGDEPLRLTGQCWWVREADGWKATECPVGPAAAAEFDFPIEANGTGYRWVLSGDQSWEETRRF